MSREAWGWLCWVIPALRLRGPRAHDPGAISHLILSVPAHSARDGTWEPRKPSDMPVCVARPSPEPTKGSVALPGRQRE